MKPVCHVRLPSRSAFLTVESSQIAVTVRKKSKHGYIEDFGLSCFDCEILSPQYVHPSDCIMFNE